MPVAVLHASVARPSGRLGPLAVEAPDEDVFTLAVAAAEALPPESRPVTRVDLVGEFPPESEWEILEALGTPEASVHRSPPGAAHLLETLRSHPDTPAAGVRLVLAGDVSALGPGNRLEHGALAVAFRLGDGPGLSFSSIASHATSPATPSARLRLPAAHGAEPTPLLLLGSEARVASAARDAGGLGYAPGIVPHAPPGTGPAPSTPTAVALRAAPPGEGGPIEFVLAALGADRDVYAYGRSTGRVAWSEALSSATVALAAPPVRDTPADLDLRAEGAYVPRPRYVENLPSRWRLLADHCGACGHRTFPSRGSCQACGSAEVAPEPLSRVGWIVEAVTTVRPGAQPTEFDRTVGLAGAYSVVVARSPEGPRATFQVAGPSGTVALGASVVPVLRRLYPMEGEWRYGRKAISGPNSSG
ncbi:MAG: hypothetical protein L3K16_07030 [Thermoplasmata archaeon]|nr:hypothetical protein [Thermoplasmata archaeon]